MRKQSILRAKYTAEQIHSKIMTLARRINQAYAGSELVMVGVLKGSLFFLADLAREIEVPVAIDFIRISSYSNRTAPGGKAYLTKDIELNVTGKHVLVIEDIIDTGRTITALRRHFEQKRPLSISFCALVDKRTRREIDAVIEFPGFRTNAGFLVGYGMDFAEAGRELREIYELREKA
ncbi:MAG: hypoxanthine phosphoribosyltransferase [Syntrophorhabdaceae bacterium]|nr:hypoxanthine phosphoribosyltransferase [Syntrophorhabdaceae bacterium]